MEQLRLSDSDRTIFAICPKCNVTGRGVKAANFYSMAYTRRQWAKEPECENCHTKMEYRYEVKIDDD